MADEKISATDEKVTLHDTDLIPIVNVEADPDETEHITGKNLKLAVGSKGDIYYPDFGLNWADLGVVTTDAVYTIAYLGNGVVVIGDEGGHVWRSTNFGLTWTDLGAIASNDIFTIVCLGNGIAIMGDGDHHIFRSTDYGLIWTDLGVITTASIYTMAYLGDGIAVLGDGDFHVWRSTDYGANWADLGVIAGHNINFILYMGSGIAVLGTEDGHVFRSTNYGANWADLGQLAVRALYTGTYLGNGLAVLGDEDHHIWRSTDYGINWTDLGVITTDSIWSMAYLGNGVVILGDQDFHIWRSTDYGLNWTDLGVIATAAIYAIAYLGNGIAIMGGNDDHVYRSTSAFQVWNDGMPPLDDFLENPPTEDEASKAPTSEWAFDHDADEDAHHAKIHASTHESGGADQIHSMADDDDDTKIQVEEGADEDIIRMDVAGVEALKIGATGIVSTVKQSAGAAYMNTAKQSIPHNTDTIIALDTEDFDIQDEWDTSLITGTADATEANKLHDADGGFSASDIGKIVWNTTDDTYTTVTGFVDSGELDLDDDIMADGEDYQLYFSRFTATETGVYVALGSININNAVADKWYSPRIYKNSAIMAATRYHTAFISSVVFGVTAQIQLSANDYLELGLLHQAGAAVDVNNVAGTRLDIAKVA